MLDKDTIKTEILPLLSKAKRGYVTQSCLIEVVNAISYKLKTGLPMGAVKALFSDKVLSHDTVYHHYNKWSKAGELKSMWIRLLDKQRNELDMSSMDLDDFSLNVLQTSASINGKKMPTTSLLMMNCMPKGILSNEPTLGWTISGRYRAD